MNNLHRKISRPVCIAVFLLSAACTGMASEIDSLAAGPVMRQSASLPPLRHAVYGELLGNGIFYSLNYEYHLNSWAAARGGGGMMSGNGKTYTNILLMAMAISNPRGHAFECGAGVVSVFLNDIDGSSKSGIAGAFALGYRYQAESSGRMIRVSWTPLYYRHVSPGTRSVDHWRSIVGLSIGYAF